MYSEYVVCCGRELHVTVWSPEKKDTVVLWHGLARTGRDFDVLAEQLSNQYRVICPDTLGRGLSQWAMDPAREYCLSFYGDLAMALLKHYQVDTVKWVGTSMGGAIGMHLAGGRLIGRIQKLVINDIAPEVAPEAVERILNYAGNPPEFTHATEAEAYLKTIYQPFGQLSEREWRTMTDSSIRRKENGHLTLHYDPRMVEQFVYHPKDYHQWHVYDQIRAKTLLIRGVNSDLLLSDWADQMTERGPRARLTTFADCGHAPALNTSDQIRVVSEFLGTH